MYAYKVTFMYKMCLYICEVMELMCNFAMPI